ncbi:MAG: hypothetical protein LBG62_05155 [Candidatus Methanoplasma sp.]|jgi:hypothetical protein|nr:hypothetical protein [Candidatus Methanoplasma sp.]
MKSDRPVVAIAIALVAIVLIGEAIVYTSGSQRYSASAEVSDGALEYSVSSKGTNVFTVVATDNGSFSAPESAYIYFDAGYAPNYADVQVAVGAKPLDQGYYVRQLQSTLGYRGFADFSVMGAAELAEAMAADVVAGGRPRALIAISGALPSTIYTGDAGDPIFEWIRSGGSLYWLGGLLGAKVSTPGGLEEPKAGDGYQRLFFGADCLNEGEADMALSAISSNGYRDALSLMNNRVRYAVDASRLPEGTKSLSVGYEEGGYSSITFVGFGEGMICVIGGDYSNYQRADLAQIVCSRICHESSIVAWIGGSVSRGSESGRAELDWGGGAASAYIYIGGYFPVYGRYFGFEQDQRD